jgi:hypothetical protein
MFIAILTLLSALSISGVAAYYSIIGLATIFPGAFVPVVLMGSVLEVGKLVCASWLYRNWKQTNMLLKSYLFFAVIVLSIVTSMGIFGFLSKAHLQNEFADGSVQQKIELINSQITAEEGKIKRQQEIINRAFGTDTSTTVRLDQLNQRLTQLDREVEAYTSQGTGFLKGDLIKKGLELKETQQPERDAIQQEIQTLTNKSTASTDTAEQQIAQSQQMINQLINQRDPLVSEKLKLEAEIGPIKYIAALAVDFGWSDKVDANSAVRWVIIVLIFVFDPLAVLMLVAANQSFIRKFPVKLDPPEEIIDLEKPDLDPPPAPVVQKIDPTIDWQSKLSAFNEKIQKEDTRPVKVIVSEHETPEVKQWNQMITGAKEKLLQEKVITEETAEQVDSKQQLDELHAEHGNYEDVSEQELAHEDTVSYTIDDLVSNEEKETVTVQEALEMPEVESVQKPIQETTADSDAEIVYEQNDEQSETTIFNKIQAKKPEYTEVIEPEISFEPQQVKTNLKAFDKEIDKVLTQKAKYEQALIKAEQMKRKNEITQEQYRELARKKEEGTDE